MHITESFTSKPGQIDRAAGVIRDCKILGEQSRNAPPNNNSYPRSTREKAIPLIENSVVFFDHPERSNGGAPRSVRDRMGVLRNVREKGDGLYGDWHFPPKHPLADSICWEAENRPDFGFSINGEAGEVRQVGGRKIIDSLARIISVDLVGRPATTAGLFESARGDSIPASVLKDGRALAEWCKQPVDPPPRKRVREELNGLPVSAIAKGDPGLKRRLAKLLDQIAQGQAKFTDQDVDLIRAVHASLPDADDSDLDTSKARESLRRLSPRAAKAIREAVVKIPASVLHSGKALAEWLRT
jgi:hypothetical protein